MVPTLRLAACGAIAVLLAIAWTGCGDDGANALDTDAADASADGSGSGDATALPDARVGRSCHQDADPQLEDDAAGSGSSSDVGPDGDDRSEDDSWSPSQDGGSTDTPADHDGDGSADTNEPPPTLAELLAAFDAGDLTVDGFAVALSAHEGDAPAALAGSVDSGILLVPAAGSPHALDGTFTVGAEAVLVMAPGACIAMGVDARLEVDGRILAVGTEAEPVHIQGTATEPFDRVVVAGGPSLLRFAGMRHGERLVSVEETGDVEVRIDSCSFDHWTDKAVAFESADALVLESSDFALDSEEADGLGEAIRGFRSAAVIRGCTFGRMHGYRDAVDLEECSGDHIPLVIGNTFHGGQDDGIDLDGCTAWVVNNHVAHFRPPEGSSPSGGVNGGGITGDRDAFPVLIGNVIDDCHHAIGFKNGAGPVLINNSITRSHIGLTLYRSASGKDDPTGVVVNTLFHGNETDIQLDGKWWPFYDQSSGPQGELTITWSRLDEETAGEGNTTAAPEMTWLDDDTMPAPGAAAVASGGLADGLGDFGSLDASQLLDLLEVDLRGEVRPREGDSFPGIGMGAVVTP